MLAASFAVSDPIAKSTPVAHWYSSSSSRRSVITCRVSARSASTPRSATSNRYPRGVSDPCAHSCRVDALGLCVQTLVSEKTREGWSAPETSRRRVLSKRPDRSGVVNRAAMASLSSSTFVARSVGPSPMARTLSAQPDTAKRAVAGRSQRPSLNVRPSLGATARGFSFCAGSPASVLSVIQG